MIPPRNPPFTIGNDICRIARIRNILAGAYGRRFILGILRSEELKLPATASILRCVIEPSSQGAPHGSGLARAAEFMAGRFAAKEAVIKAHHHRLLTFSKIAIVRTGPPTNAPTQASVLDAFEKQQREGQGVLQERMGGLPEGAQIPNSGPLVAVIKGDPNVPHDTYASISISHDSEYATAVCLAINPEAK
ncbi:hypothetical protein F5B17DRAFT_435067 [Nemania serpens]|nr:hypothetical protein F5B17DRAFT_435067 [Nemania serpens]